MKVSRKLNFLMLEYWYAFPFATLVSTFAMITGGEGAILFVPFFILIGLDPGSAVGTAFITQLFGKSSGTIGYIRTGGIQKNIVALLVFAGAPTIVIGSYITSALKSWLLQFVFGMATIALSLIMLYSLKKRESTREDVQSHEIFPKLWIPSVAGLLTGIFAVGAGTINLVFLERMMGLRMHKAVATVVAAMAFTAIAGALVHIYSGEVFWHIAIFTIAGVLVGGQIGPRLAKRMESRRIKELFVFLTYVVGSVMCMTALL